MAVRTLLPVPLLFFLACSTPEPERRAIDFLAREAPDWPVKNRCCSCHNNGDAARAHFAGALARADGWLLRQRPVAVLEAGALLLGPADAPQRAACLEVIRKGEFKERGWGPYVTSPPEVFDTAVVLLGLAEIPGE